MPRTKISKTSKRNREATNREDKIRQFDSHLDQFLSTLEETGKQEITSIMGEFKVLIDIQTQTLKNMKVVDFLKLSKFSDWSEPVPPNPSELSRHHTSSILSSSTMRTNPNDEGYLTEDSTTGVSGGSTMAAYLSAPMQMAQQRGRTPGPLSSARARRPRRSRSAAGEFPIPGSAMKSKPSAYVAATPSAEHNSRSKLRTPMVARSKALSADRNCWGGGGPSSPTSPPAFMRWPKPGEIVLSKCGSPVVTQFMPEKFANVNIPIRNGVLSLRPKKLGEIQPDLIENIDPETLSQIKTLHASLNMIMSMADKACK